MGEETEESGPEASLEELAKQGVPVDELEQLAREAMREAEEMENAHEEPVTAASVPGSTSDSRQQDTVEL